MTTVNVTEVVNTVTITDNNVTTTIKVPETSVVTATTAGPQGPAGILLTDPNKVDKSIIYYDSTAGIYKADSTWTTSTVTFGGNF